MITEDTREVKCSLLNRKALTTHAALLAFRGIPSQTAGAFAPDFA
jgi:hypothetical protein